MKIHLPRIGATLALAVLLLTSFAVNAADLRVLISTGMKEVLDDLAPHFEKETGHKLSIKYDTSKSLVKAIDAGEHFDATLLTDGLIASLTKKNVLVAGSRLDIARSGLGLAIRAGAPRPNIETTASFKKALLEAKSIGSSETGMAGVVFMDVLKKLGIESDVKPKIKLVRKGYVADIVASGDAELAVHLVSEILPVKGAELLGPFPPELQKYIVLTGAVATKAKEAKAASDFVRYFKSPIAVSITKKKGMDPL